MSSNPLKIRQVHHIELYVGNAKQADYYYRNAFGFDRITMLLAGAHSLRDVIAFPKTTAARALFEGAPTVVPPDDLRALHIKLESERA